MKVSAAFVAPILLSGAHAFVPPQQSTASTSTALRAENDVVKVASACLLGLGVSAQAALAAPDAAAAFAPDQFASVSSSSTVVAEIDQFSMPSYDNSKGSTLMDITADIDTVNKKTLAQAKAKREFVDNSAEKLEADELRKAEKEGSSLLDSMIGQSEKDKRARIDA